MNFIYLDPGLLNYAGHHASFCRHLTQGLQNLGHSVSIYANCNVSADLRRDLNASPLFRIYPYSKYFPQYETASDPICGWLKNFELSWQATLEDLNRLNPLQASDVIYWNSAFPAQLVALAHWLKGLPNAARPRAVMELNLDSGAIARIGDQETEPFEIPDPRVNERPLLWRYAGMLLIEPKLRGNIKFINFEPSTIPAYEYLLREPVEAWTPPFAGASPRSRVGKQAFAIGILGHQREEKGFALVPELARRLLASRQDIALLVHNSDPELLAPIQQELRQVASKDKRLVLWEGPLSPKGWFDALAACDLIVCPYNPVLFATRCSGLLNESLANAIPVIIPANTSLARVFEEFGAPGAAFERWDVESISASVHSVLNFYDKHSQKAFEASAKWIRENNIENLASTLAAWADAAQMQPALTAI